MGNGSNEQINEVVHKTNHSPSLYIQFGGGDRLPWNQSTKAGNREGAEFDRGQKRRMIAKAEDFPLKRKYKDTKAEGRRSHQIQPGLELRMKPSLKVQPKERKKERQCP